MPGSVKPLRIALVGPTKNRPELFAQSVAAIRPQVDKVITVTHGEAARVYAEPLVDDLAVFDADWNISSAWNLGLNLAQKAAGRRRYDVAVINDDAIVDTDWFDRLSAAMHTAGAAAASGSRQARKLATMAGYGFLLDGTKNLRADENLRHWYSDDGIEARAIKSGGVVIINGVTAVNHRADTEINANPTLRAWAREDVETFRRTYGEFVVPSNVHRGTGRTPLVISAPSGKIPTNLLAAAGNRPILVLTTDEWEDKHLAYAASAFDWFVFVKESTRIIDPVAFWATIDARNAPAWLFAHPSCYMGLYARAPLQRALKAVRVNDKWGSVMAEAGLSRHLGRDAIWPEICDANALRVEAGELVIGNSIIEKSKGSAWCGHCSYDPPGICEHVLAGVA